MDFREIWDNILDFIEDNKGKSIAIGSIIVIFLLCLVIRSCNMARAEKASQDIADMVEVTTVEEVESTVVEEETKETFKSNVGFIEEEYEEETTVVDPESLKKQEVEKLEIYCKKTGHTVVPIKNVDGSSCKNYQKGITTESFDSFFGSQLTTEEVTGTKEYILVGTEQIMFGDLQSTGWLIKNLDSIDGSTPIYFTNLHAIGHLSNEHVYMLCSYDWYSAFGLKDTLVVLEDISGTLDLDDFIDGDVISTVVLARNIQIEVVNGQTVVHIEYATEGVDDTEESTEDKYSIEG